MAALDPYIILFGGVVLRGTTYVMLDDTWRWDGKGWTAIAVAGPPARSDMAMAAR